MYYVTLPDTLKEGCGGGGQAVGVLAFYSDDPSLNLAEGYIFVKIVVDVNGCCIYKMCNLNCYKMCSKITLTTVYLKPFEH